MLDHYWMMHFFLGIWIETKKNKLEKEKKKKKKAIPVADQAKTNALSFFFLLAAACNWWGPLTSYCMGTIKRWSHWLLGSLLGNSSACVATCDCVLRSTPLVAGVAWPGPVSCRMPSSRARADHRAWPTCWTYLLLSPTETASTVDRSQQIVRWACAIPPDFRGLRWTPERIGRPHPRPGL
jgi:hypothetical protein